MKYYIGIDPSLNSTGITVYSENKQSKFYIIKSCKLTKKEKTAQEKYKDKFEYKIYECSDTEDEELNKTYNIIKICDIIENIIKSLDGEIYVCMEGISYGSSVRTRSIFDLSGLNYMIRNVIVKTGCMMTICSPKRIKKFAVGDGNAKKEMIIDCFKAIFQDFDLPKIDDISDSYFMARYASENQL